MLGVFIFVYLVIVLSTRAVATEDYSLNNPDVYIHYYTHEQLINITEEIKEVPVYKNCTNKDAIQGCCTLLTDKILCTNVDQAVYMVETLSNVTSIFIGLLGNNSLNSSDIVLLQNKKHVVIVGVQFNYGIDCIQPTGFVFRNIEQIDILNITWKSCGFKYMEFLGAVVFDNCYNISIVYSLFSENFGSAVIINHNVLDGSIRERGDLTTALWKSFYLVSVIIRNSNFTYNGKQLSMDTSVIYGGGILFRLYSILSPLNIEVIDSNFHGNNANFGGGIAVIANTFDNTSHKIVIMKSLFKQNTAYKDGGAFYQLGLFITSFTNCRFIQNSAQRFGGAVTIVGQNTLSYFSEYFITFERTCFVDNAAYRYAAIYLLISFPVTNQKFEIRNSSIKNNYIYPDVNDTDNCIIYISSVNTIISNSTFVSNRGSCICLDFANLYIDSEVMYYNNTGYRGAALNLKGESKLFINNYSNLIFSYNTGVYGGAIFKAEHSSSQCVFDFDDVKDYQVMFTSNIARFSGQSIFYAESNVATECKEQIENNSHVVLFPSDIQQIETTAMEIIFLDSTNETDEMNVSLGIYLSFNAAVASTLSSDTSALVYVSLIENDNNSFNDTTLKLNGFTSLTLKTGITSTDLYFTGIDIHERNMNFSLVFSLLESYEVIATLKLNLLPCNLGFIYDDSLHHCVCVQSNHILCNERLNIACIQRGYWFGTRDDQFIVSPCFSGFCKNTHISCESCILEDGGSGFCKLQSSEAEECSDNREGIACVYCMEGYKYTYGAVACVEKSKCGSKDYAIIISSTIMFLIVFVVLLIALLKLDMSLNAAYLYCFIYYYSVVRFVLPPSLIHKSFVIVDSFLESFTQLNPIFLGYSGFSICFSLTSQSLYLVALNYLFPIAIGFFVLIVIFGAKCYPRLLKFSDNTPVRAICLLLLFSFTAIAETSFEIINAVRFSNIKGTFVASDPQLEYLRGKHIWLWIIAMLFMIVFILPFTFLLTFSPSLMRCCNLIKIKPYLDQFHGVYKDEYRWMSGFYFIGRLVYYSVLVHPDINQLASVSILRYVGVIVALFHCIIQPYKSKFLNVADGILLGNIVFLSLLNDGTTIDINVVNSTKWRLAFTYILLLIPIGYIFILLAILCLNKSRFLRNLLSHLKVKISNSWTYIKDRFKNPQEPTFSIGLNNALPTVDIFQEREPLIRELGQVEPVTVQKEICDKPVVIKPQAKQPKFSELFGPGNITPGKRHDSFLIHYTKYDDKEGNDVEIHEVI